MPNKIQALHKADLKQIFFEPAHGRRNLCAVAEVEITENDFYFERAPPHWNESESSFWPTAESGTEERIIQRAWQHTKRERESVRDKISKWEKYKHSIAA